MRVRLDIARHELPTVKILWNVAPEAITISKLLEQIHDAIPLESDGWGIEDYAVEVNGYEALHYLNPNTILHEDDEVKIRALQTPDIRVRSLSGRYQISAEGAHLIDGIAFGKTYLKRPSRPPVYIPPRKRPRLSHDYHSEDEDYSTTDASQRKRLRIEANFEDADEELQEPDIGEDDTTPSFASDELPSTGLLRSGKTRKSVSFDESSLSAAHEEDDVDEDDEDEEDYVPDGDEEDDEDEVGDESDDDRSAAEINDKARAKTTGKRSDAIEARISQASEPKTRKSHKSRPPHSLTRHSSSSSASSSSSSSDSDSASSDSSSNSDSSSSSEPSDSDSSDSSESEPEEVSTKPSKIVENPSHVDAKATSKTEMSTTAQKDVAPGKGKRSTKARNVRRAAQKQLNYLKQKNIVESGAIVAEFKAGTAKLTGIPQHEQDSKFILARNELLESLEADGFDKDSLASIGPQAYPSQQEEPSAVPVVTPALILESPRATEPLVEESEVKGFASPNSKDTTSRSQATNKVEDSPLGAARKSRAKLDLASSNRLIFGSLGVRTPRTKADEEKVRARLGAKTKPTPTHRKSQESAEKAVTSLQEHVAPTTRDPEAWRSKINLIAIECSTPEIGGRRLTTPPFPFKQGWDPSARMKGKKRKRSEQRFFKGEPREGEPVTHLPFYLEQQEAEAKAAEEYDRSLGDGLNYDDVVEDVLEPGSLVEDSQETDLPALPADMPSLPVFTLAEALEGAIIAFRQYEVSEATKWQPAVSDYKTTLVVNVEANKNILRMQLAKRDDPHHNREYDWKGRPLYGKFEMAIDVDDDAEGAGIIELPFLDLIEPKLLRAAPSAKPDQVAKQSQRSKLDADSETMRVPESMHDEYTQTSLPSISQRPSHSSEHSSAPSTSTLRQDAQDTTLDTPQLSLSNTSNEQTQQSASQTLDYDDLQSDNSQRSNSFASAAENGSHNTGGLVVEASA